MASILRYLNEKKYIEGMIEVSAQELKTDLLKDLRMGDERVAYYNDPETYFIKVLNYVERSKIPLKAKRQLKRDIKNYVRRAKRIIDLLEEIKHKLQHHIYEGDFRSKEYRKARDLISRF